MPFGTLHVFVPGNFESKKCEVTKPQTSSWRDSRHWSRLELRRIRAASGIASDDDHYNRSGNHQASTSRVGFSCRSDRALFQFTSGANAGRFDLSTRSDSASTVDEQQ